MSAEYSAGILVHYGNFSGIRCGFDEINVESNSRTYRLGALVIECPSGITVELVRGIKTALIFIKTIRRSKKLCYGSEFMVMIRII